MVIDVSVTAMQKSVLFHVNINAEYKPDTKKRKRMSIYLVDSMLPAILIPILTEQACSNFEQLFAIAPGRHNKLRTHVGYR